MRYPTSTSSFEPATATDAANLVDAPSDQRSNQPRSAGGLLHLVVLALTLVSLGVLAYFVPSLERVRPWVKGEGVPVVRLFTSDRRVAELPQFEGAAANVPRPSPGDPASGSESEGDGPEPDEDMMQFGLEITAKEYAGAPVAIENPKALKRFFEALRHSAEQEPGATVRVAHYGDSSVAADEITQTVRRKMQLRFGDAGHGFMLMAKGDMHYVHRDVSHGESDGWELSSIVRRGLKSGFYGYGGVLARAWGGESASFGTVTRGPIGTSVSRFEVFFQRFPNGGDLKLTVDNGAPQTVRTRSDTTDDGWHVIDVPDGPHSLTVRTTGEVRLYGVVQERAGPGVVYDALGLVGARADRLLDADPAHMARQIAHRDPDLLVLAFGGNEAGNDWLDPARYAQSLRKVIHLMRAGKPEMSCLLFAPLDQAERTPRGRIITLSLLPAIVLTQREVAISEGCAFFDTWTAMGGEGAMERWYEARPRLVSSDLRHATPAGYAILGTAYYKAMLESFANYLAHGDAVEARRPAATTQPAAAAQPAAAPAAAAPTPAPAAAAAPPPSESDRPSR
jgi:lysophospholipase L1-like esterase